MDIIGLGNLQFKTIFNELLETVKKILDEK
jgi:hypothetical protein